MQYNRQVMAIMFPRLRMDARMPWLAGIAYCFDFVSISLTLAVNPESGHSGILHGHTVPKSLLRVPPALSWPGYVFGSPLDSWPGSHLLSGSFAD